MIFFEPDDYVGIIRNEPNAKTIRLVRDKALSNWRVKGSEYQVRPIKSKAEHEYLLKRKIIEEAMEVIDAPSNFEVVKELADVLAVLKGIANFNGFDWETVLEYAEIKEKASGPFTVGMVWDRTITKDEDGS